MDVEIHPNAKKHLTEKQVLGLRFRRNPGKRSSELGKGVDDEQDVYGR